MSQALQEHRRRLTERGMKRVEVCVRQSDVDLIRKVAKALVTGQKDAEELRDAIETVVPPANSISFKEWLASTSDEDDDTSTERSLGF